MVDRLLVDMLRLANSFVSCSVGDLGRELVINLFVSDTS